jgi:hypothetical protein
LHAIAAHLLKRLSHTFSSQRNSSGHSITPGASLRHLPQLSHCAHPSSYRAKQRGKRQRSAVQRSAVQRSAGKSRHVFTCTTTPIGGAVGPLPHPHPACGVAAAVLLFRPAPRPLPLPDRFCVLRCCLSDSGDAACSFFSAASLSAASLRRLRSPTSLTPPRMFSSLMCPCRFL